MQAAVAESVTGSTIPEVTFGSLYREHHAHVLAYFLRRFDRDTAVDCAAEVFTVAWRRRDIVPGGDRTLPWLYAVCRNVGRNQERSRRRSRRLAARIAGQASERPRRPDDEAVRRSEDERIAAALARLRSQDRELLRLLAWEELPRAEIAHILGCSRHAVDQRIQRAMARLRKEFERTGDPR